MILDRPDIVLMTFLLAVERYYNADHGLAIRLDFPRALKLAISVAIVTVSR